MNSNSILWHLRCPHCGYEIDYEFVLGKTPHEVACPKDGWQMAHLRQAHGLHASKKTIDLLTSGIRTLLVQGSVEDIEHAKYVLNMLNHVLGDFENNTDFVKLDLTYTSVSLDGKY